MNPFEVGCETAKQKMFDDEDLDTSDNPYQLFSAEWGMFNHGYNRTAFPWLFPSKRES